MATIPGNGTTTIGGLVSEAREALIDRLDAQLLIAHRLGRSRTWVITHDDDLVAAEAADALRADLRRRAEGEPLAYIVGWKEFRGLRLAVSSAVLVPRPDTETLVDWALDLIDGPLRHLAAPDVVDLGTGSGAVALGVKAARSAARLIATDMSPDALDVARGNAAALGLEVDFRLGDWWQALGDDQVDLALANAPYVAVGDPHMAALRHEPRLALESGADGLDAIRTIVRTAWPLVRRGGWLLFEHGDDQQADVAGLLHAAGFAEVGLRRDLSGLRRCTGGRKPG